MLLQKVLSFILLICVYASSTINAETSSDLSSTTVSSETTTSKIFSSCLPPFQWFGSGCFYIQPYEDYGAYNWNEAKSACEQLDSTIAYIINDEEQNTLTDYMLYVSNYCTFWIGLKYIDTGSVYEWSWEGTNQPVNYTAWYDGYPASIHINGNNCAWMNYACNSGEWANYESCARRTRQLLCRRDVQV